MKPSEGGDHFTVIFDGVLRERFERWLRRNHLQMTNVPGGAASLYVVVLPADTQRRR